MSSPSKWANEWTKDSKQKDGLRFRNHRPANASDIPVQFYHQIFEEFIKLRKDYEDERANAFRNWLELFFDNEMDIRKEESNIAYSSSQIGQRITDGSIYPKIGKDRVLLANIEVKPEPGMNGSCYIQNDAYYKEFVIKSRKQESVFYYMTCLPAFLINLEGPNVSISGAVSVPFIVCDHLTDIFPLDTITYNHTKADDVAQIFLALKKCLYILKEYYNSVYESNMNPFETIANRDHLFPCINKVNLEEGTVIIKYKERYSINRNLWMVEIQFGDKKAKGLVKFTQEYSGEAHGKCFELGLALKLWAVNSLQLGWKIVIMEYLEEYKTLHALDSRIFPQTENAVRNAVKLLHDSDYVHGNFRDENIMAKYENGEVDIKIVDFDLAGREGRAKYPESLNPTINWHLDVGWHKFIKKEHDKHLIDYIYHNITYEPSKKRQCLSEWMN
ncbi:8634_t:CDS:2 [Entrophospora sp. SA101]|nr:8634_t:CDS:2 [Entrophospora sp. SA101]